MRLFNFNCDRAAVKLLVDERETSRAHNVAKDNIPAVLSRFQCSSQQRQLTGAGDRCDTAAGQPGLLRPGISCFVTSARSGYANRPKTGN